MTRLLSIAVLACCGALVGTGPLLAAETPVGAAAPAVVVAKKHHHHHKGHHGHHGHKGHHATSTTQI